MFKTLTPSCKDKTDGAQDGLQVDQSETALPDPASVAPSPKCPPGDAKVETGPTEELGCYPSQDQIWEPTQWNDWGPNENDDSYYWDGYVDNTQWPEDDTTRAYYDWGNAELGGIAHVDASWNAEAAHGSDLCHDEVWDYTGEAWSGPASTPEVWGHEPEPGCSGWDQEADHEVGPEVGPTWEAGPEVGPTWEAGPEVGPTAQLVLLGIMRLILLGKLVLLGLGIMRLTLLGTMRLVLLAIMRLILLGIMRLILLGTMRLVLLAIMRLILLGIMRLILLGTMRLVLLAIMRLILLVTLVTMKPTLLGIMREGMAMLELLMIFPVLIKQVVWIPRVRNPCMTLQNRIRVISSSKTWKSVWTNCLLKIQS